jgi:hypothetical protein
VLFRSGPHKVEALERLGPSGRFESCSEAADFEVVPGRGYVVRMRHPHRVELSADSACVELELAEGSNRVGLPGLAETSCAGLLEDAGSAAATLQGFDEQRATFQTCAALPAGTVRGGFDLVPGQAYVLGMTAAGQLALGCE